MNGTTSVNFLSLLTFCSHFLTGLRVFEGDEGFGFAGPPKKANVRTQIDDDAQHESRAACYFPTCVECCAFTNSDTASMFKLALHRLAEFQVVYSIILVLGRRLLLS